VPRNFVQIHSCLEAPPFSQFFSDLVPRCERATLIKRDLFDDCWGLILRMLSIGFALGHVWASCSFVATFAGPVCCFEGLDSFVMCVSVLRIENQDPTDRKSACDRWPCRRVKQFRCLRKAAQTQ
jgi:hypothetical protein